VIHDRHPRLVPRARLHYDRHAAQWMILYPERGLALNATAAAIAVLLTGERSVEAIVDALAAAAPGTPRGTIARDVRTVLDALTARRLLEDG
jgi:coenzyme PQQ biosynthesis protein PqqD